MAKVSSNKSLALYIEITSRSTKVSHTPLKHRSFATCQRQPGGLLQLWQCRLWSFLLWCTRAPAGRDSSFIYSHLSDKRGAHAYQFWKIPPSSKKKIPPPRLLISLLKCLILLQNLMTTFLRIVLSYKTLFTTKIDVYYPLHIWWFSIFGTPPRLFQAPRLLERWEYIDRYIWPRTTVFTLLSHQL